MDEARHRLRLHRARRRRGGAGGAVRQGGVARVRFRARPGPGRRRQPDDDALGRVAGDRARRSARSMARRYGADGAGASTSARSTRSAAPPRSGRTRCWRCSTEPLDVMVVIGGYNSSNTCHLAALVRAEGVPHLPHRGRRRGRSRRADDPPPADRHQAGGGRRRLARRGPDHRHHRRRLDAEQQDRRDDRPHLRDGRRRESCAP